MPGRQGHSQGTHAGRQAGRTVPQGNADQRKHVNDDSTRRTSQAVPHPSANRTLRRLASEVTGDSVHSVRRGRRPEGCAGLVWGVRSPGLKFQMRRPDVRAAMGRGRRNEAKTAKEAGEPGRQGHSQGRSAGRESARKAPYGNADHTKRHKS